MQPSPTARRSPAFRAVHRVLYAPLFATLVFSCGGDQAPAEESAALILARDKASEYALLEQWKDAGAVLSKHVGEGALAEDLLRVALSHLAEWQVDAARPLVERAALQAPEDPVLLWCEFRLARLDGRLEEALVPLEKLRALRPDDFTVRLALAMTLDDIEQGDSEARAEAEYRALLAVPVEYAGSWRMTVLYRLNTLLTYQDRREEGEVLLAEFQRLSESLNKPGEPEHQQGTLGAIRSHTVRSRELPAPRPAVRRFKEVPIELGGRFTGLDLFDPRRPGEGMDMGEERKLKREEVFEALPLPPSLVAYGPGGVTLIEREGEGWKARSLLAQPVLAALPFDRANAKVKPSNEPVKETDPGAAKGPTDADTDLLVASATADGTALHLLENSAGAWTRHEAPVLVSETRRLELVPVDYDHDGDLDLAAGTEAGARLWRNDGFDVEGGGLTAVTDAWAPRSDDVVVVAEDLDGDDDVDFLLHGLGEERTSYLSSQRAGRFEPASLPEVTGRRIVAADFDGNGWPDLARIGDAIELYLRTDTGAWREPRTIAGSGKVTGKPFAVDLDLDGIFDLVWPTDTHPAAGVLAPASQGGGLPVKLGRAFATPRSGPADVLAADLDGDRDIDLARVDDSGLALHLAEGQGPGLRLTLAGHKDNSRAIGAVVELRNGSHYRRIFWSGRSETLAFADEPGLDLVRVTWPNGVIQNFFDLRAGKDYLIWQRRGLVGSCPFLYTWNGTTYEFISDVLGITPLGLPMAPGMLVPPDHDEFVLVKGEQLVPRDGFYELQITEELREVTYLDRVRLDVIDHPSDVEIYPNERFSFPPFPVHEVQTVEMALVPLRATGSDGKDWTAVLAANDRDMAAPFAPEQGQFQGLASPHWIELEFDARAFADAERLRLVMNGWLFWTDASVNVAAARHPDKSFVPPLLQVPDGAGGWTTVEPPLGFPAGKLKTMVVDVTSFVKRDDPRLRIFSTLRLYWDSIRLAACAGKAPFDVHSLEPVSAELWERGFSEPQPLHGPFELEWFDWDRRSAEPRWDMHPGLYTKLGETLPLVGAIDDRFVILGAGDALTVRFDATGLPAVPAGYRRDFLVFFDGWAKDRDPNTEEALYVEPLPFHGMSGYPYGADEHFPDGEVHELWRREWNTRPGRRWIRDLRPTPLVETRPATGGATPVEASYSGASAPGR